ncbi:MAG TPA: tetratricopeptide repeat protein [Roseiflexaceae bacterium]|nr:tetratricopeptide repeat protein [Roseiflexaceae bacterium]
MSDRSFRRARAAILLALAAALLAVAAPSLLWAYHLDRAGALLERGLAWPQPRLADALPTVRDPRALDEARAHLAQAQRWRPDHPHAYRLAGHAALARGDWPAAVRALEAARARAPRHPLIAWETGLAYEQFWRAAPADSAAHTHMVASWRAAGLTGAALRARGDEALALGHDPQPWYARAAALQDTP